MNTRVLHILSGDLWGGSEAQMALQIQALRNLGCDAQALLFNDTETAQNFRERDIPLTVCPESVGILELVMKGRAAIAGRSPHVVVSHGYKELVVACLSTPWRTPIVHMTHGLSESYRGFRALKSALYRWVEKTLCSVRVSHRIVVTEAMRQTLRLEQNVSVIRCVGEVKPTDTSTPLLRPAIVAVGRLTRVKRFDRAIRWISELNAARRVGEKFHLSIIGTGELEQELKDLTKTQNAQGEIHFLGFRRDSTALIKSADLLLISSESEGLPTVLVEALLSGTPVCTTDLPGIREALNLFPSYPAEVIANNDTEDRGACTAIVKTLQRPRATERSLQPIQEYFSAARAAKEHMTLYERLLAGGPSR